MNKAVQLKLPPAKSKYLWRYMDLHKFISFITTKKLFFTRLDKFDDPFEGVATSLLRRDAKYANIPTDISLFPTELSDEEKEKLLNEKKLHDYLKQQETNRVQTSQYVSCWFAGARESMAMWNLYSNKDSIAIRGNFSNLKFELENSFLKFVLDLGYRIGITGDEVKYLKLNPFDLKLQRQSLRFSALKKDVSFQYENEYRFLIYTIDRLERQPSYFEVPVDIDNLTLTVVTHPNMEQWKYDNIQKLIELAKVKMKLMKSVTVLRQNNG